MTQYWSLQLQGGRWVGGKLCFDPIKIRERRRLSISNARNVAHSSTSTPINPPILFFRQENNRPLENQYLGLDSLIFNDVRERLITSEPMVLDQSLSLTRERLEGMVG